VKESLRKKYLTNRKGISDERREGAQKALLPKLEAMTEGYKNILSYSSFGSEVSMHLFNRFLQGEGRLCLPRIEGQSLVPYAVSDMEKQLITFSHKFLEPDDSCRKSTQIDLVLVPGVAFDKDGARVGFGRGFYDKYLEKTEVKSIGICFKEQVANEILTLEEHDIPMESLCIV